MMVPKMAPVQMRVPSHMPSAMMRDGRDNLNADRMRFVPCSVTFCNELDASGRWGCRGRRLRKAGDGKERN